MATETSAAPNNTTLPMETSAVVPDTSAEKASGPGETSTSANAGVIDAATPPAATSEKANEPAQPASIQRLWALAKANGHPEIWGVTLADPESHVPTQIILQKYLNANDGDVVKAEQQLTDTLQWRAKTRPLDLVTKKYSKAKFDGLGYVTIYGNTEKTAEPESKEVFTWNVYGVAENIEETFGNQAEFLEWRTALMEMALQKLDLSSATKPVTADYDPYKIFQVHDYKSVSFLRSPPQVRSASQETIKVFATNYPELLKEKFFVNVPGIMGFVYTFMKLFVAAKTIKKFHPMSNGGGLAREFGDSQVLDLGAMLSVEYGGKGGDLRAVGVGPTLE